MKKEIQQKLSMVWEYILDTIAPPDPEIRMIERMTPEKFIEEAMRGEKLSDSPGIIHFLPYRGLAKTAVLELKRNENRKIARMLAKLLYDLMLEELSDMKSFRNFTSPLLLPVPMTPQKKRRRGWNQCELIAEEMVKLDKSETLEIRSDILRKIRDNKDQIGMGRSERFKNLEGSFSVRRKEDVTGRNTIIFDDVVTTGATLSEARRALLASGAKKVFLIALAH